MSVDDRLRAALRDQADGFVPAVEDSLDRVRAQGRREWWRMSALVGAAPVAAAAVLAAVVLAVGGPGEENPSPVDLPTATDADVATDAPPAPLRGWIVRTVERPPALAGRWSLRLDGNGSIDASPPDRFTGDLSGSGFTADGTSFRTSLFGNDLCADDATGIYSWQRAGDRIEFRMVSDTCTARVRFFADSSWTASTGASGDD